MQNTKLRSATLLSILLITGFLFTSFVSYFTAHESISSQVAKTTLPLSSDNIYSEIQRDLLPPIFISSMMAKDTFVRDWVLNGEKNEDEIIKYLKEIQVQYGTVTSFFVSDKTRKYYHPSGVLETVNQLDKQDRWYFRVQKMSQDYEVSVDIDTTDHSSLTVFINYRVYDYSGNYIGAIGVGLALNAVQKLIENYNTRYGREVYFVDKNGQVTLRAQSGHHITNIHQASGLSEFAQQILSSSNRSIEYQKDGKQNYLNSRFVPEFGWYLIVAQEENEAEENLQNILMLNLVVSFFISILIIFLVNLTISSYQKKLETMATTDKLTGCANRQMFKALFQQAHNQSMRSNIPLSAIMLDLDYFKEVNDTYGHPTGDVVLKALVQVIKSIITEPELLFRWGGEEFLIILPESDLATANSIAETIRKTVAELRSPFAGKSISVTISLGVACMSDNDSSGTLIEHADDALYRAKENGRNRTECYPSH